MFLAAAEVSETVSTEETIAPERELLVPSEVVEQRVEAPHITTCLGDTEVEIGTAVTLEATVEGIELGLGYHAK